VNRDGQSATVEPSIERLVDLAVYAPVGVFVTLRNDLPKQIKQRRQALENRVQLARFIGQLAVQQGRKEIAKRLDDAARQRAAAQPGGATSSDVAPPGDAAHSAAETATDVPEVADVVEVANVPDDASTLPIAEYQSLAAIHVVQRLATLRPDELEQIRRFEAAHRARRTILAKIAQLQDPT
jgi:TolA-binding protein